MEALSGSLLNVVLKIKEGNGFGFLSSPLIIVANLNGNALETEPITCTASPVFGSDFVWEAEKKILRRMRSGNTSLRIECMCQKSGRKKEKIGYILLNLKQAQIVNSASTTLIETWYRLLGVRPEMKPHNPEILLSLLIKEADFALEAPPKGKDSGSAPSKPVDECGYIQIGPAVEATQLYSFSVDITAAVNLHTILDDGRGDGLSVNCLVFGTYFSTKDLSRVNGDISGEKLHLTLRSSPQMLSQYFTEFPQIEFTLLSGLVSISKASLTLQAFVSGCEGLGKQGCVSKEGRVWFSDLRKAYVDVVVSLCCEGYLPGAEPQLTQRSARSTRSSPSRKKKPLDSTRSKPEKVPSITKIVPKISKEDCSVKKIPEPAGQIESLNLGLSATSQMLPQIPLAVPQTSLLSPQTPQPLLTESLPLAQNVAAMPQLNVNQPLLSPHLSTGLSQPVIPSQPAPQTPRLATHAELSAMPPMPGPQVPLPNFGAFVPHQPFPYQQMVQPLGPSVSENPFLPVQSFIQPPSQISLTPIQIPAENPFASMLQDNGDPIIFPPPIPKSLIANQEVEKTRELTKNIIEELEDWKEKQQMMYKIELKAKCEREVKRLTTEWSKRQAELEAEMGRRVEESANLTEQLHTSAAELAHRNAKVAEVQKGLELEKEKREAEYASKLQELREASKKHQHYTAKQLKELQDERDNLKRKLYAAEQELERYRAGANPSENKLTDNQMTSLLVDMKCLEEKLAAALESKEFFRKEWGRALREIHKMKTEQEAVIRQQLEANRNELNNLSMRLRSAAGEIAQKQVWLTEIIDDYPKPEDNLTAQVTVAN